MGDPLTTVPSNAQAKKRFAFFREVKGELKKVNWTPRAELFLCAKIVVLATVFFGFAVYLVDLSLRSALQLIGSIMKMVFFGG